MLKFTTDLLFIQSFFTSNQLQSKCSDSIAFLLPLFMKDTHCEFKSISSIFNKCYNFAYGEHALSKTLKTGLYF